MAQIPRLLLHVGAHKTGTSSVQHFLVESRARLRDASICYPAAGQGPDDWSYGQHELPRLANVDDGMSDEFERLCDSVLDEFAASGCRTLLLSSEDFLTCRNRAAIARRFDADEVQIVAFLRPQHEQATAIYYNTILGYGTLDDPLTCLPQLEQFLDYLPALAGWRNAYPHATFRLRRFEKGQPARSDAIREFVATLDLPLTPPEPARFRENATLPARGILFLRAMLSRGFSHEEFAEIHRLLQANGDLVGSEKSVYSPDERRAIHEAHRERNRRLRAEFDDGRPDNYFDEPELGDESAWRAAIGDPSAVERTVFLEIVRKLARLTEQPESQTGADGGGTIEV